MKLAFWRPRSEIGRKLKHKILTGTATLPPRGTGLGKGLIDKLKQRPVVAKLFGKIRR